MSDVEVVEDFVPGGVELAGESAKFVLLVR